MTTRPHVQRTITLPADLDALRQDHAASLPTLSTLATTALRQALARLGATLPPPPPPGRTHAATQARARRRAGAPGR